MEPRLLIRPPSARCNCCNRSAQETRKWKTLRTVQVEALARELATQQATMTQGRVRSRGSLVDVKHVTKQNELSRRQDRMEQWRTWSFKMRAYRAARVTKLYYILSGLMDDRTMDTGRTGPVRNGVKRWRWMVACWEPRAFCRAQRAQQAILVMEWNITDTADSLADQVKDCEQQYSNKTFGGFSSSYDPRTHDECDLMAAEIQAAVCGLREQSEKDCCNHAIKGSEKGQRKGTRTKDDDDKGKGVCNKCDGVGVSALNCLKEIESSNASYSGKGDPHCLTYTDDQFHWITTMGKVAPVVEQSNITELLLDSGAACRVRPCRVTAGYSCDAFLTATGAQTTFQGTLEVKSQRIDVHGEKITVTTRFRLIPVRRPIMSVCRPVGKEVVVILKRKCRYN